MSILKIAIVSNTTWNIVNFRLSLIKALIREGHEVFVISPRDSYVSVLEAEGIHHLNIYMDNKGISPLRDLRTMVGFFNYYARHRFDLVLHYTIKPVIYGGLVSRLLGRRYISTVTGLGTVFIKPTWVMRLVGLLYRFSQKNARRVFFQNSDDMRLFLRLHLVRDELAEVVPGSGLNTDYFRSTAGNQVEADDVIFLMVARMLRDKGVVEFVQAARSLKLKHPNVRFQLLGPLDVDNSTIISQQEMDAWVNEGMVEYISSVDDVRPYLQQATCVVLPSYREGLPRTLLEAAAMEKPLIATDTAGCRDVVMDGVNGFLCNVADAKDLAEKMVMLMRLSKADRAAMGVASRKHVLKNFDEEKVIACYLKVIHAMKNESC